MEESVKSFDEFIIFDFISEQVDVDKTFYSEGNINRRWHSGNLVGATLVIYGGKSNVRDVIEDDVMVLDLNKNRWRRPPCKGKGPSRVYGHSSAFVVDNLSEITFTHNIFNLPSDCRKFTVATKIRYDGLWFFGGENEDDYSNELYNLRYDEQDGCLKWKRARSEGMNPEGRKFGTMDFFPALNSLILFGGLQEKNDIKYIVQVYLFEFENMCWI